MTLTEELLEGEVGEVRRGPDESGATVPRLTEEGEASGARVADPCHCEMGNH